MVSMLPKEFDDQVPFTRASLAALQARLAPLSRNPRVRAREFREAAYKLIRDAIEGGALAAGDRLPAERDLVARLSTTRRTIRAVLLRLEAEGMIRRRQGSGTEVAPQPARAAADVVFATPSVSPLDAIEARRVIETNLAELVAARATEEDFERMRLRLEAMADAADQQSFKAAGYAFHLEVVRATRNPLLVGMYEMLIAARARAGWGKLIPLNDRKELRDEQIAYNRSIYEALLARDVARASELARAHLSEMVRTVAAFPSDA